MDYLYIEKCSKELEKKLRKERILNVFSEEKKASFQFRDFFLNIYFGQPNAIFLSKDFITKETNPKFNSLKGTYIRSVFLPIVDRVLEIEAVNVDLSGKVRKFYIIFELTGKNANLFLLSEDRKILSFLREVKSLVRPLEREKVYVYPPQNKKEFDKLSFGEVTREGIEKNLYKFVAGISPLNSKELAVLFKLNGSLEKAFQEFIERHKKSNEAFLYYENGKPKYMTTFSYISLKELSLKKFSGETPFLDAWRTFYLEKVERENAETLRRKLLDEIDKRIKILSESLKLLRTEEELLVEAERFKKFGELLKYNLHMIKPGTEKVKVFDYYENKEVEIPIDPSLHPKELVETFFAKYKKLKRRADHEKEVRKKLREDLLELEFLKETVSKKETIDELKSFEKILFKLKKDKKGKEKRMFNIFVLPSGKKIVVGRSSKENELLTLKLSNPWDLWFHAKNIPGSHVILKLQRGEKPSEEDIELAASAAAFFSKGKESGKVEVDYTEVKNVKKPPKTPTGFVIYKKERTIVANSNVFSLFLERRKGD
ncbi:MAG: NFACT family protein [Desulfurobacteriaceae bacterium]